MEISVIPHPKFYRGWSNCAKVYKVIKLVAFTLGKYFSKDIERTRVRRLRKERATRRKAWKEERGRKEELKRSSSSRLAPNCSCHF